MDDISSTVALSKLIKDASGDEQFVAAVGKVMQEILEVMQQSDDDEDRFTAENVNKLNDATRIQSTDDDKGRHLLQFVNDANDGVKKVFAFALLAVDPNLLKRVSLDLFEKVCEVAAIEYIKVGGATIPKKAFESVLKQNLNKANKKEIVFIQVGKPGVGKSSLINSLTGTKEAKTSSGRKACTRFPIPYDVSLPEDASCKLVVWDTPGLYDAFEEDDENDESKAEKRAFGYLKTIANKVPKIDLFIFCVGSSNPRFTREDSAIIRSISQTFEKDVWKRTLFVLTKTNMLRSTDDTPDVDYFNEVVGELEKGCREMLKKHKIEDVDSIPFIPAGSYRDKVLPNGKAWLPEFWVTAVERATDEAKSFLLMYNGPRLDIGETSASENSDAIVLSKEQVKRVIKQAPDLAVGVGTYAAVLGGGVGLGAAVGAAVGAPFFGPIGAAVGAGIGAGVGLVGGGIANFITWWKQS